MKYKDKEGNLYTLNKEGQLVQDNLKVRKYSDNKDLIEISKQEHGKLLNEYFKNITHEWEYQGVKFRKLPNFESNGYNLPIYPVKWSNMPKHKEEGVMFPMEYILVYYRGKVKGCYINLNYYPRVQLFNLHETKYRWTNITNVAPIQNMETKEVI